MAWIQQARSPALDAAAHAVSFLGDEPFYLLLLPLLYWSVNRAFALRLTVLFLLSAWANQGLKALLDQPRPSAGLVDVLEPRGTGGLPSGHAQGSLVVWGYLALRWPLGAVRGRGAEEWRRVALTGAGAIVIAIALSRLYLGVHFPHDLIGGWLVGGLLLAAFLREAPMIEERLARMAPGTQAAVAVVVPLLLLGIFGHEGIPPAATLLGVGLGAVWERSWVRFSTDGGWATRATRVGVGLLVAVVIWAGLSGVSAPFGDVGRAIRYALLGVWVTGGAPWLFVRTGLAPRG